MNPTFSFDLIRAILSVKLKGLWQNLWSQIVIIIRLHASQAGWAKITKHKFFEKKNRLYKLMSNRLWETMESEGGEIIHRFS